MKVCNSVTVAVFECEFEVCHLYFGFQRNELILHEETSKGNHRLGSRNRGGG